MHVGRSGGESTRRNLSRSYLINAEVGIYSGALICPSSRRSSAGWTSQTSNGKCWSLLSQSHLKEKIGEAGPGEILATS
jgi:hypothetical protein